ncbi:hypothetical protein LTS18_001401 [Coniosporium uncinatum]|uniref:Uncharacterized protein n=1 Tax=Coniosporium uncinatum TaxID=93489 RepID=A0ACC3DUN1_9PEZI|nr:hypothetical protein LTS18_001401 [Coniosporium uncinatum]
MDAFEPGYWTHFAPKEIDPKAVGDAQPDEKRTVDAPAREKGEVEEFREVAPESPSKKRKEDAPFQILDGDLSLTDYRLTSLRIEELLLIWSNHLLIVRVLPSLLQAVDVFYRQLDKAIVCGDVRLGQVSAKLARQLTDNHVCMVLPTID